MRKIPLIRFDAWRLLPDPMARVAAEEIAWFEEGEESVLGLLIRDRIDGDFGGIVLGRTRKVASAGSAVRDFTIANGRRKRNFPPKCGRRLPSPHRSTGREMGRVRRWTFSGR